jgi:trk system potassium uptake protein TrkA
MAPLWGNRKQDYVLVVGCGQLGANFASRLSDAGVSVTVIDSDREAFTRLSPSYAGLTVVGDATSFDVLHEAEIERATAVVAVTNYDNTNILVAQLARRLFGIEQVVARLFDMERADVYRQFNIATVSPSGLSITELDRQMNIELLSEETQ